MDTAFFYISKLLWALAAPGTLLCLALLAGIVLVFLDKPRPAKLLLGTAGTALALIAFLPAGKWLAAPLENRFPANPDLPAQVDGIILLGGGIDPLRSYSWNQPEFGAAADRYTAFIELAKRYPRARLLFTGGSGALLDQAYKEADVALYFLESMGVGKDRLSVERDSRNTRENAVNSKALVMPQAGETWVLVTSAAHMPRAVGVFCSQGWPVMAYPVDHETAPGRLLRIDFDPAGNLSTLNDHSREWAGLAAYFLTGKTPALLPGDCHQSVIETTGG